MSAFRSSGVLNDLELILVLVKCLGRPTYLILVFRRCAHYLKPIRRKLYSIQETILLILVWVAMLLAHSQPVPGSNPRYCCSIYISSDDPKIGCCLGSQIDRSADNMPWKQLVRPTTRRWEAKIKPANKWLLLMSILAATSLCHTR